MSAVMAATSRSVTFDALLDWFRRQGGQLVGAGLRWQGHEPVLLAQRDLMSGERVLLVPRRIVLSSDAVRHSEVGARLLGGGIENERTLFATWLAVERHAHRPWRPLLEALPQEFSRIPMLCPRTEQHWLQGTSVAHDARSDWDTVREQFRRVNDLLPRAGRVSLRDFAWGWQIYISQVFAVGTEKQRQMGLVPLGGLLPHAKVPNCAFRSDAREFEIYTTKAVTAGTPLKICFGQLPTTYFFSRYGWFPEEELSASAVLPLELGAGHLLHLLAPALTHKASQLRFWLTHNVRTAEVKRLRSVLRLLTARSRSEAREMMQRASGGTCVPFVDGVRERHAMHTLREMCRASLAGFTSTAQQDGDLLDSTSLSSWQRQCVLLRRAEKTVVEQYLRHAEQALSLLERGMPSEDECEAGSEMDRAFLRELRSALPSTPADAKVVAFPAVHAGLSSQERHLCNWFFDQGGTLTGATVRLKDGLRGMVSLRNIAAGETVMRVPRHLFLTDGLARQSEVGRALKQQLHGDDVEHTAYLALLVADTRRNGGHWAPMVNTLPQSYSRPECFEKAAWELLEGTDAAPRARDYWKRVRRVYRRTQAALPGAMRVNFRTFLWAHLSVCTRSFNLNINGKWASGLIPVAEMFNHAAQPNCDWGGDNTRCFEITANKPIEAGTPLTISYGSSANTRLLGHYGFCLEDNDHETITLRLQLSESHWLHSVAPKLTCGERAPEFEIGLDPGRQDARRLFSLLRWMNFADAEFAKSGAGVLANDPTALPVLNLDNEIGALRLLVQACEHRLSEFPAAAQADEERLTSEPLTTQQRMALVYRLGQRRMAETVLKYAEGALEALLSGNEQRASALAEAAAKSVGWGAYFDELRGRV